MFNFDVADLNFFFFLRSLSVPPRFARLLFISSTRETVDNVSIGSFVPLSSWDNATFAQELCAFASWNISGLEIGSVDTGLFLMPDCFYTGFTALSQVYFTQVIVQPSRLLSNVTVLGFKQTVLADASGIPYTFSWANVFGLFSELTHLSVTSMQLSGSLPASLPAGLVSFIADTNRLSGSIPSTLFENIGDAKSLLFSVSGNRLNGSIPSTLLAGASALTSFSFDVSWNALSGSLPTNLLGAVATTIDTATLTLSNNYLSGSIPATFLTSAKTSLRTAFISINFNSLTGGFPSGFFSSYLDSLYYMTFSATYNSMTGSLPSAFFGTTNFAAASSVSIDLSNNGLTGSLPSGLFTKSVPQSLIFTANFNKLSGSIPATFFGAANWTNTQSVILHLANNALTGGFPTAIVNANNSPKLSSVQLYLDGNSFTGSIPATFWSSLAISSTAAATAPALKVTVSAANARLTGAVTFPALTNRVAAGLELHITLTNNSLTSVSFDNSSGLYLSELVLSTNTKMTGTVPSAILDSTSVISRFQAAHTALSGPWPDMVAINNTILANLDLSYTSIEFCAGNRTLWNSTDYLTTCVLTSTTAYSCSDLYPTICTITAPEPVAPAAPISTPSSPAASPHSAICTAIALSMILIMLSVVM